MLGSRGTVTVLPYSNRIVAVRTATNFFSMPGNPPPKDRFKSYSIVTYWTTKRKYGNAKDVLKNLASAQSLQTLIYRSVVSITRFSAQVRWSTRWKATRTVTTALMRGGRKGIRKRRQRKRKITINKCSILQIIFLPQT